MLDIKDSAEIPSNPQLQDVWMETSEQRKKILQQISTDVVDKFIDFHFHGLNAENVGADGVFSYAKGLFGLGWNTVMQLGKVMVIVCSDVGGICYLCSTAQEGRIMQ